MAQGINKVILVGHLGADPELRVTGGGQSILNFRIATTESYQDRSGERKERTEWHRVSIWGKRGEMLAKMLRKGERVYVEGSLRTSSYEKNGEKRYSTDIVANEIVLCGGALSGGSGRSKPKADDPAMEPGYPEHYGDEEIPF